MAQSKFVIFLGTAKEKSICYKGNVRTRLSDDNEKHYREEENRGTRNGELNKHDQLTLRSSRYAVSKPSH